MPKLFNKYYCRTIYLFRLVYYSFYLNISDIYFSSLIGSVFIYLTPINAIQFMFYRSQKIILIIGNIGLL
jgi:hypothetical protein